MKAPFALAGSIAFLGCQTPHGVFVSEVQNSFKAEKPVEAPKPVTEEQIAHLPSPVKRYLRYAGVVGKPMIQTARLKQSGLFKTSLTSDWKNLNAEEYFFPNQRSFFWKGTVTFFPLINANARDKYAGGVGNIWVKLANIVTVADGRGEEFNRSNLIRYLNELVWFPSAFLDSAITWKPISESSALVTMSDHGMTTSATMHFNDVGEMILFESDDRYAMVNGGLEKAPWITPMRTYKEFDGYKVPTEGEAIYLLKSGRFEYGRIIIEDLQINRTEMYKGE